MSKTDYSQMSDRELKQYLLNHRDDKSAFEAYLDRWHQKSHPVIIKTGELDSLPIQEQISLVAERLKARFKDR